MSSDLTVNGNNNRPLPLKPTLASTRTAAAGPPRTPLTPRIAGTATPNSASTAASSRPTPRVANRAPAASPRVKPQGTPAKDAVGSGNVTPRTAARKSRVGGTSPAQDNSANDTMVKASRVPTDANGRSSGASGLSLPIVRGRSSRPNSVISDSGSRGLNSPMLLRSPGITDSTDSIDSRFFHASEAARQDPVPKKAEPKKTPTFFYADGQQDAPTKPVSPVLSAVNDHRPGGPWIKPDVHQTMAAKSPPMLSPSLNSSSVSLSYFPPTLPNQLRSPSPSKENIHLSYRKGVSQIFGTRPAPHTTPAVSDVRVESISEEPRRPSFGLHHRKSTSLSSINSGSQPRRRSNTAAEGANSPLTQNFAHTSTTPISKAASPNPELPSIETLASPALFGSPSDLALSPTKSVSQLAADARRERKVLDLEISNSSLMAINSSLEREVRRQKAELKRFRRLSRAGRFSFAPADFTRRKSEGLGILSEDGEDADLSGLLSGLAEDDATDSEDEDSVLSGSEPLSPSAQSNREQERLAKDEKRLQVDLQRHKELLVQSQAMNQSLKRCMYATEEMIREGKKALEYHVRVSDIKLGGRILTGFEDEDEGGADDVEVADDFDGPDDVDGAENVLGIWSRVGRSGVESDSGDRDSGIEVDKPFGGRSSEVSRTSEHPGRPPDSVN